MSSRGADFLEELKHANVVTEVLPKVPVFVVQEHFATHHHFDLRLERDGVLKSWAVPKGVPLSAGQRRLAVQVDDHQLEYAGFEGVIPEGEYGAGRVLIWDKGEFEALKWEQGEIKIRVRGQKLEGVYVMVNTGGKSWLLMKKEDETKADDRGRSDDSRRV